MEGKAALPRRVKAVLAWTRAAGEVSAGILNRRKEGFISARFSVAHQVHHPAQVRVWLVPQVSCRLQYARPCRVRHAWSTPKYARNGHRRGAGLSRNGAYANHSRSWFHLDLWVFIFKTNSGPGTRTASMMLSLWYNTTKYLLSTRTLMGKAFLSSKRIPL